jgi:hypothetical protein
MREEKGKREQRERTLTEWVEARRERLDKRTVLLVVVQVE